MKARKQHGMTLIELMVALAIGAFLMIGAITVFMQSRTTFRVTESIARMQENARFALDVLEPDIRMAHYWGLNTTTSYVDNQAQPDEANGPGPDTCGNNWTIDLEQAVAGSNNGYDAAVFGCAGTLPDPNADTLIVRRAMEDPEPLPLPNLGANTLRLQSVRAPAPSLLFTGTAIPAGYGADSQTHRMVANGYYVSQTSTLSFVDPDGVPRLVPALRVWTLLPSGAMQNQEVIAGVEDLQVQLGVDTDLPDNVDERSAIDRWVNVNDPMVDPTNAGFNPDAVVLGVRIWVRVRAERPENGFVDTTNYVYADQDVGPFNDNFRRLVVSKTIYLRNARPLS